MTIFVGRWDALPAEVEGYNGLVNMNREEIVREVAREMELYETKFREEDSMMGAYTPQEFEEAFNYDSNQKMDSDIYWIRIYD